MLSKSLQDIESKVTVQLQVIAEQQSEFKHNQEDHRIDKDKGTSEKKKEGRSSDLNISGIKRKEIANSSRVDQEIFEKKETDNAGKNRGDEGDIKDNRMRSSELNFK